MQYTCAGSAATTVTGSILVPIKAAKMQTSSDTEGEQRQTETRIARTWRKARPVQLDLRRSAAGHRNRECLRLVGVGMACRIALRDGAARDE
jgi:hypothetical protein